MSNTCTCCTEERKLANLPPRELVQIGLTPNKGVEVKVCPNCDGEQIIELSRRDAA